MKSSLGQHIPDLFVPQSAGGRFPKSTRPTPQKLYFALLPTGVQLIQMEKLNIAKETAEAPLGEKEVLRVLCGPFYSAKEAVNWKPVAEQRNKQWGAITSDPTRDRDGGMKGIVYETAEKYLRDEEERKEKRKEGIALDEIDFDDEF